MCFVWIWEQTAIISLYSINWLVCTTEREFVYCAVRPGSYIKLKFIYAPLAMPWFRHLVFALSSLGPGFNSKSRRGSLWWRKCRVLHISHECSILLFIHTFQLPAEKMGEAWPAANESVIFRKSWREGVAFRDHRAVCSECHCNLPTTWRVCSTNVTPRHPKPIQRPSLNFLQKNNNNTTKVWSCETKWL